VKTARLLAPLVAALALSLALATLGAGTGVAVTTRLVLPDGTPLAGARVWIAVWNVTGNYPLAVFDGYTDAKGAVRFTLPRVPASGLYNVTVAVYGPGGALSLGNWTRDSSPGGVGAGTLLGYVNSTVVLGRIHRVRFRVMTDLNGDGTFETPLYYEKATGFSDVAYVRIGGVTSPVDSSGFTKLTFNLSDLTVTVSPSGTVASVSNATYGIDVFWRISINTTSGVLVKVGSHAFSFTSHGGSPASYNLTDSVSRTSVTGRATGIMSLELHGYTYAVFLDLATFCVDAPHFRSGSYGWAIYVSAPSENGTTTIRVGSPNEDGVAPASTLGAFWLPNTTAFYGSQPSVRIQYYGVVVYDESLPKPLAPGAVVNRTIYGANVTVMRVGSRSASFPYPLNVTVMLPLVTAYVQVFDSEPTPVPLEGAAVTLEPTVGDPIPSVTGPGGYVQLPPFVPKSGGASESGGQVVTYESANYPYGFMPIPYHLLLEGRPLVYTWSFRIKYRTPSGTTFVDVTPDDNTLVINAGYAFSCTTASKAIFARVYAVKLNLADACGSPLRGSDYPNTSLLIYRSQGKGSWSEEYSAPLSTPDGSVDVTLPAGTYRAALVYKGIPVPPASGATNFTVSSNSAFTVAFPIGNLTVRVYTWDKSQPLYGLLVRVSLVKNGKIVYTAPPALTDGHGEVSFPKMPLRSENATIRLWLQAWTTNATYFIRLPRDAGLPVANQTLDLSSVPATCNALLELPAWIYSFRVTAADCRGSPLREGQVVGVSPAVAYLIIDGTYGSAPLLPPPAPSNSALVDFRIVNVTGTAAGGASNGGSFASWVVTSKQFDAAYPHLFVAGASYRMRVVYAGVVVFDYNVTLPRPGDAVTVFANETVRGTLWLTKTGLWLNSTYAHNFTFHPVVWFNGTPPFSKGSLPELRLFTWTTPVSWFSTDWLGRAVVPTRLAVVRSDVLNMTVAYSRLQSNATQGYLVLASDDFTGLRTWAAFLDDNGVLMYPAWAPRATPWIDGVSFGARAVRVYALGRIGLTPSIPDSPQFAVTFVNATGASVSFNLTGYPLNLNSTTPSSYAPEVRRGAAVILGNNTGFSGAAWNLTYWCGSWKLGKTIAISGICVKVRAPGRNGTVPYPGQPVGLVATGSTGAELLVNKGVTGNDGTANLIWKLGPPVSLPNGTSLSSAVDGVVYAFGELNGTPIRMSYRVNTTQNLDPMLSPYNLKTRDVFSPQTLVLTFTPRFSNDVLNGGTCLVLEWAGLLLKVVSWAGQNLKNMFAVAVPTTGASLPVTGGFTEDDGFVALAVLPDQSITYRLQVFWRDSYLLQKAGAIPKFINIFSSDADYDTPRAYRAGDFTTIEAFVYIGLARLTDGQGNPLPPSILNHLTVYVTWPDGVVTKHAPQSDGTVNVVLNPSTVVSWPHPASASRSTDTPPDRSEVPPGAYEFKVVHDQLGVVGDVSGKVEKARTETPLVVLNVPLELRGFDVRLVAPTGDPLPAAQVEYFAEGMVAPATAVTNGSGHFRTVAIFPKNGVFKLQYLKVVSWMGAPVGFEARGVALQESGPTDVVVDVFGRVEVFVVGSRGQGLGGASVLVPQFPMLVSKTDDSGHCSLLLPEGVYTLIAERGGRRAEVTFNVTRGQRITVRATLDVWITVFGVDLSASDAIGLTVMAVLLAVALTVTLYEYHLWRTRRAVVVRPAAAAGAGSESGQRGFWRRGKKTV